MSEGTSDDIQIRATIHSVEMERIDDRIWFKMLKKDGALYLQFAMPIAEASQLGSSLLMMTAFTPSVIQEETESQS